MSGIDFSLGKDFVGVPKSQRTSISLPPYQLAWLDARYSKNGGRSRSDFLQTIIGDAIANDREISVGEAPDFYQWFDRENPDTIYWSQDANGRAKIRVVYRQLEAEGVYSTELRTVYNALVEYEWNVNNTVRAIYHNVVGENPDGD